jgi:hypothetical protein
LEETEELQVAAHLFVDSRAAWDVIAGSAEHFDEMPEAEVLAELLRFPKNTG